MSQAHKKNEAILLNNALDEPVKMSHLIKP